jgi:hypothetical protein
MRLRSSSRLVGSFGAVSSSCSFTISILRGKEGVCVRWLVLVLSKRESVELVFVIVELVCGVNTETYK